MAEVGEQEEIVVEEDSTDCDITLLSIEINILKSTATHWIAGDVPLKGLLPSAENVMFFLPLYV